MIYFPNCKINIGLFVTGETNDGFHSLESIFYPINLCDILEMRIKGQKKSKLTIASSNNIEKDVQNDENNTIWKAFNLIKYDYPQTSNANIYLYKNIPVFAGLGGGSSDASHMLRLTDYMFNLHLSEEELMNYATKIGSDCAFFLKNSAQFVYGRGEKMQDVDLDLNGYYILLIKPNINISTKEAYKDVNNITEHPFDLRKLDIKDIVFWKDYIRNDFEEKLFVKYPLLKEIKQMMYSLGAIYAQMSGSGSTIYGIFEKEIDINRIKTPKGTFVYQTRL